MTQGGKGSLTVSSSGGPVVPNTSQQHVLEWIGSAEQQSHCTTVSKTGLGCWIQTGWEVGSSSSCGGSINTTTPTLYLEVYDDSSSPCLLTTFPGAPTASYDARYVSDVNGLHRYHAYYQDPSSSTIQDLGWGDFKDLNTTEAAKAEVYAPDGSVCPVVAQTISGYWNLDGYGTSPTTFASTMSLYQNGAWHDWTTATAQTAYWPYSGITPAPPYQIQGTSDFTTTFTQWKTGGPNG